MGRFLIYFAYIGTKYRGIQIQPTIIKGNVIPTVQGVLHESLSKLRPANEYKIFLSSRTDTGVHALKNACHVDLTHPVEGKEYNPEVMVSVLNYHLKLKNEEIRILKIKKVPKHFHCRLNASGRKYVYRLAHLAGTEDAEHNENFLKELNEFRFLKNKRPCLPYGLPESVLEQNKLAYIWKPFDVEKLILGAQIVSGIHNYGSFSKKRKESETYLPHPVKMLTIGVKRGQPLGFPFMFDSHISASENLQLWDIHVRSKSFLYRQVRRVVGAMVLLATNHIKTTDLQDILDNPRTDFSFSGIMGMPDHGLYLVDVEYNPRDLEFSSSSEDNTLSSTSSDVLSSGDADSSDDVVDETDDDQIEKGDNER
ncbi:tRNA pseudouridine synthase-like 1 [Biomphalaria pfeifferi]|uniref:tRNA pseudouridine synthase n=1 Tax=Biomphalaria pfeifferi TaxID=112525 RepID=A0AAD8BV77_BIOPF|nr:tRNA pseudouridine synthase-like 1 [Biomphalaria pfeifferi]